MGGRSLRARTTTTSRMARASSDGQMAGGMTSNGEMEYSMALERSPRPTAGARLQNGGMGNSSGTAGGLEVRFLIEQQDRHEFSTCCCKTSSALAVTAH